MKKYKFSVAQLKEFFDYLATCLLYVNECEQETFGSLLHYHLKKLQGDFAGKMLTVQIKHLKNTHVTFNLGELITLSYCFKRCNTPPFLKGVEFNLIEGL